MWLVSHHRPVPTGEVVSSSRAGSSAKDVYGAFATSSSNSLPGVGAGPMVPPSPCQALLLN